MISADFLSVARALPPGKMDFIPPNLSQTCSIHTTVTSCQPSTFVFLQLITSLFGQSRDSMPVFQTSGDVNGKADASQGFVPSGGMYMSPQYDFIVVGAGSAGCVVANRLSELANWRVLLIEAGGEEPEVADVPGLASVLPSSNIDWGFTTEPSPKSCLARRNGRCSWPRGRVMGGSSTINYMIYIRGGPRDYDEWAAMGNKGWSYRDVLPYFMKSEDNHNLDRVDPNSHGVGGYLSVETFPYQDQNVISILNAYREFGLAVFDQNSGERQIGASILQHTTRDGQRWSTNVAFIRPIRRKRRNLVIETNAFATRVLVNPQTKQAYGVEYVKSGRMIQAFASKEVIVSAGALLSPKLLMLSGIGPAEYLHTFGIPTIKDLTGVGINLQDHTSVDGVVLALTNGTSTMVDDNQRTQDVYYYRQEHRGPLSSTGLTQLNAFIQTKYETENERPDVQFSIDPVVVENYVPDPITTTESNVLPTAYYDGIMIRPILLRPDSTGIIFLNRSDPVFGLPEIHANTFLQGLDLARLVDAIKRSMDLLYTPTFKELGLKLVTTPLPACKHVEFATDDYWACLAMSYTNTMYHYVGTCKMGPKHDPLAVVDPQSLKVYGIGNLRVVDASVMPRVPRGNTNAGIIMVAEKASDMIKSTWLKNGKFSYKVNKLNAFLNAFGMVLNSKKF